jgi:S-adenosylmethionine decarboxylase
MDRGEAWLVDAHGCDPESLRSREALESLFADLVRDLRLNPLGPARWHEFPGTGGITGFLLLSESHLACHTFPETGFAALDLYCCRRLEGWRWEEGLRERLGARSVVLRRVRRGGAGDA